MSGLTAPSVQTALVAARRLRRPARLLLAAVERAERVDADSALDALELDLTAGLSPFLIPPASSAAWRPDRSSPASAVARLRPPAAGAASRPVSTPGTRPEPRRRSELDVPTEGEVAEHGGRVTADVHPVLVSPPEGAARDDAATGRPPAAQPIDAGPAHSAASGPELLAQARDRLRQAGGTVPTTRRVAQRTPAPPDPHAAPTHWATPDLRAMSATSGQAGLASVAADATGQQDRLPAANPAHDPMGPPAALAGPSAAALAGPLAATAVDTSRSPTRAWHRATPPSRAMPQPEPTSPWGQTGSAGTSAAPRVGPADPPTDAAASILPPPARGARSVAPALADDVTALREEAYRHGVDVT